MNHEPGQKVAPHTGLGFTPHIRGKRPNVLRAAQPRIFFSSPCSEKQFGCPNYFSKPYQTDELRAGRTREQGFTLIETMVALGLLGLILAAVFSVMQRSSTATGQLDVRNDLLSETQLAQNYMVSRLREAAYVFTPDSGLTGVTATLAMNSSGYTMYNPAQGNWVWRLGVDPIVAFVVPPKVVTPSPNGCDGAPVNPPAGAGSNARYRANNCYAFYAFYAIPRGQITGGVPSKGIAAATGVDLLPTNSANNGAWVLMEYRAYYTTTGYSKLRGNIPTDGTSRILLDYVLPTGSGEKLFTLTPRAADNVVDNVLISLATQQTIGGTNIRVPGSSRYNVRVYPRNLNVDLDN